MRSRGFLTEEDLARFRTLPTDGLIRQLESEDAVERSGAIRLLALMPRVDDSLNTMFLDRLTRETKLYTKLELCTALQSGGLECARLLAAFLGKIGSNQHKHPSEERFRKTSYPLPRDIIARVLARMDPHVLPVLVSVISDGAREEVVEVIDAIGFMCFYSEVDPRDKVLTLNRLIETYQGNPNDDLVQWKIVRALESFNHGDSLATLADVKNNGEVQAIRQEAQRSLVVAVRQPSM